jgi:O-antigen/teichoic acid export membrane protein
VKQARIERGLWQAIGWSMLGRYASYIASVISLMVLGRVFTPEAFGLLASVQAFLLFLTVVAEGGVGPAIIRRQALPAADRDAIFLWLFVGGGAVGMLLLALQHPIIALYGDQRIAEAFIPLAIAVPFAVSCALPVAQLAIDRRFLLIGGTEAIAELISIAACIAILQLRTASELEALAWRVPIRFGLRWLLAWAVCRHASTGRAGFSRRIQPMLDLLRESRFLLAFNIINFWSRNADQVAVGAFLGATPMGLYEKACTLMRYPLLLISHAMSPAIQPSIQACTADLATVRSIHTRLALRLAAIGVVAAILLGLGAPLLVHLVLGPQWVQAADLVEALAWSLPVQLPLSLSGAFFQALGRTGWMLACGLATAACMAVAIAVGIAAGDLLTLCHAAVVASYGSAAFAYAVIYGVVLRSPPVPKP